MNEDLQKIKTALIKLYLKLKYSNHNTEQQEDVLISI